MTPATTIAPAQVGEPPVRADAAVLRDAQSHGAFTRQLLRPLVTKWSLEGRLLFLMALGGTGMWVCAVAYTVLVGIGTWGNNVPVGWAFGITNFVWWVGIGHAGTFISAFLLLLEQRWRTSINRLAEAMTIFAVIQAGMYPLLHLGRPWFFYWLIPYPATMKVWPQFRSALPWDAAAVGTYLTVSVLFWYVGLIPDLAAARETVTGKLRRKIYGVFALGWRGSGTDWKRYRLAYGLLAGLATPLVISVHSVVSLDFASTILPGWHSTIFPPYFVAGALYSGFAMVLTLAIPIRRVFELKHVITDRHLDGLAKMLAVTGWIVIFSYCMEFFTAYYSGEDAERSVHFLAWPLGPYRTVFWAMIVGNVITPQLLWSSRVRRSTIALFAVSILVNVGMWAERFIIIVGSLSRDFLPSSWGDYAPSIVDLALFVGSMSFFATLFMLFLRFVPIVPVSELGELKHEIASESHA